MIASLTQRIVLAARPEGRPKPNDFRLETMPVPDPGPGQILLEILYLSLDPYMRGRMDDAESYAKPVGIGEVMSGETISRVASSNDQPPSSGPGEKLVQRDAGGWG